MQDAVLILHESINVSTGYVGHSSSFTSSGILVLIKRQYTLMLCLKFCYTIKLLRLTTNTNTEFHQKNLAYRCTSVNPANKDIIGNIIELDRMPRGVITRRFASACNSTHYYSYTISMQIQIMTALICMESCIL